MSDGRRVQPRDGIKSLLLGTSTDSSVIAFGGPCYLGITVLANKVTVTFVNRDGRRIKKRKNPEVFAAF